jgi:hypothetical protein
VAAVQVAGAQQDPAAQNVHATIPAARPVEVDGSAGVERLADC